MYITTEQQNKRGHLPLQSLQSESTEGYRHHLGESKVSMGHQGKQWLPFTSSLGNTWQANSIHFKMGWWCQSMDAKTRLFNSPPLPRNIPLQEAMRKIFGRVFFCALCFISNALIAHSASNRVWVVLQRLARSLFHSTTPLHYFCHSRLNLLGSQETQKCSRHSGQMSEDPNACELLEGIPWLTLRREPWHFPQN